MVLVDHIIGYLMEGGAFLELTPEAAALGFAILTVALIVWEIALLLKDPRETFRKKEDRETSPIYRSGDQRFRIHFI